MNNKIKQVVVDNLKEGEYVYAMQQQLSIFKKNKMKTKNKKYKWKNGSERLCLESTSNIMHVVHVTRNMQNE